MRNLLVFLSVLIFQLAFGSSSNQFIFLKKVSDMIIKSSQGNFQAVNQEAVIESLYRQIRPKVKISKINLSEQEVDKIVIKYIESTYYPVLVQNYIMIYRSMKKSKADILKCEKASYFESSQNILATLCVEENSVHKTLVNYKTILKKSDPKVNVSFIFNQVSMVGIDLRKGHDVKFSIRDL